MRKSLAVLAHFAADCFFLYRMSFRTRSILGARNPDGRNSVIEKRRKLDETIFSTFSLYSSGSIFLCGLLLYAV